MPKLFLLCVMAVLLAGVSSKSPLEACCLLGREFATRSPHGESGDPVATARICSSPALLGLLRPPHSTGAPHPLRCRVAAKACCLRVVRARICQSGAAQAPHCESAGLPGLTPSMGQIRMECCLCCSGLAPSSPPEFESCSLLRDRCPVATPTPGWSTAAVPGNTTEQHTPIPPATEGANHTARTRRHPSDPPRAGQENKEQALAPLSGAASAIIDSSSQGGASAASTATEAPPPVTSMPSTPSSPVSASPEGVVTPKDSTGSPQQTSGGPHIICESGRVWDPSQHVCVQTIISCPRGHILHPTRSKCVPILQPAQPCLPGLRFDQFENLCADVNECQDQDRCNNKTEVCRNTVGSYTCDCQKGFKHNKNKVCEDIDECWNPDLCSGEQRCKNTFGSYRCIRAIPCGFGWQEDPDSNECVDIDECTSYPDICGVGMKCVNIRGSHQCEDDECPPHMKRNNRGVCSRCKDGFLYDNRTMTCEDIDECTARGDSYDGPCKDAEVCFNLPGTFECVPKKKCRFGTVLTKNGTACEDINECQLMRFRCQSDEICLNTYSSYQCVASPCAPSQQFDYALNKCVCRDGFQLTRDNICVDIDECADTGSEALCGSLFLCVNHPGGYACIHRDACPPGMFRASMYSSCQDVDECETGEGKCASNMHCVNVVGSYRCMCNRGFVMLENNTCADVNECLLFRPEESCPDLEARCVNMAGGYKCQCPQGFQWSNYPVKKCLDINECANANPCGKQHECINTIGSYKCRCRQGYRLAVSGDSCEDVDECQIEPRKCINGICVNVPGRYVCRCPPGFAIDSKEICHDINECSFTDRVCSHDDQGQGAQMCINLLGYYKCVNSSCGLRYSRRETGQGFICQLHKDSYCTLKNHACLLESPYRRVYEFVEMSSPFQTRSTISRINVGHLPPGVLKSKLQLKFAHNTDTKESISVQNVFQLVSSVHDRENIDLVLLRAVPAPAEVLLYLQVKKYHQDVFLGHSEAFIHLYFTRYPQIVN